MENAKIKEGCVLYKVLGRHAVKYSKYFSLFFLR